MALEKRIETGAITVLADGQLQLRTDTVVLENGVELSRTFHRRVLDPIAGKDELTGWPRLIADVLWTPEVIDARRAAIDRARNGAAVAEPDPGDTRPARN